MCDRLTRYLRNIVMKLCLEMISEDIMNLVRRHSGEGKSYREVAKLVSIAPNSVRNIILGLSQSKKAKTGPKSKLTKSHLVMIKRRAATILASGAKVTANKIKSECCLNLISTRTIRRRH